MYVHPKPTLCTTDIHPTASANLCVLVIQGQFLDESHIPGGMSIDMS